MTEGPPPLPIEIESTPVIREKLPVAEVSNEVIFTNQAFPHAPFAINEGEPTKLGVFLTTDQYETRRIGIARYHKRSGVLGQVVFEDIDGNKYRDVDAKGVGYTEVEDNTAYPWVKNRPQIETPRPTPDQNGVYGLMDKAVALKDASMAEELISHGVRTYRVLGITKLNEIILPENPGYPDFRPHSEKVSIKIAIDRGLIPKGFEPVVEIRAFGTHRRVIDIGNPDVSDMELYSYVADAKRLVAQELGISSNEFSDTQYVKWFAESLAKNVARMHKSGYTHEYLTRHNVALDCRIVDLDSVTPVRQPMDTAQFVEYFRNPASFARNKFLELLDVYKPFNKDFGMALVTLKELLLEIGKTTGSNLGVSVLSGECQRLFQDSYLGELESTIS